MRLYLRRFAHNDEATLGALLLDGQLACLTLEDQRQLGPKVMSETRIPAGTFKLKLRTEGGMHKKYAMKFEDHRGMLWLQDVPNFEYIYIHVGVIDDHTAGCILVADSCRVDFTLADSTQCYRRLYAKVSKAILAGEKVEIMIEDADKEGGT